MPTSTACQTKSRSKATFHKLSISQRDAFTLTILGGTCQSRPASHRRGNSVSETAFSPRESRPFPLRWFIPILEVPLRVQAGVRNGCRNARDFGTRRHGLRHRVRATVIIKGDERIARPPIERLQRGDHSLRGLSAHDAIEIATVIDGNQGLRICGNRADIEVNPMPEAHTSHLAIWNPYFL